MADHSQEPSPAEELFAEWLASAQVGEGPDFSSFCRDRPEHALALRKLHEDWQRFQPLLEMAGSRPSPTSSAPSPSA